MTAGYHISVRPGRGTWHGPLLFGVAALGLAVSTLGAAPVPRAVPWPSSVIVDVNRTEPAVAINPRNPLNLVVTSNSTYDQNALRRYPAGHFASFDGGVSWRGGDMPMHRPYWTGADTSVAFDSAGTAYMGLIGEDPALFCKQSQAAAAILVARSTDGGRSVSMPVVVDVNPSGESDDKPYLAVWNAPATSARAAHTVVYMVWTRWLDAGGSRIMFSRSQNGGRTFSPARMLYSSAGSNMGAMPAVGPRGELYVAWAHWTSTAQYTPMRLRILVQRSLDGGATFGSAVPLALSWGLPLLLPPGLIRVFSLPSIAIDSATGAVYVAWPRARVTTPTSYAPVAADIVLSRSIDRGATWTDPIALNDSSSGDRFMPSLAVLPDGRVAVIFYDRRADHHGLDVYLAAARDKGGQLALYANRRLTTTTSPISDVYYIAPGSTCLAPGRFVGDYISLATDSATQTLSAVWADTQRRQLDQTDLRYSRIPYSRALLGLPRLVRLAGSSVAR